MYIDQMEITGFGLYSNLTLNLEQGLNIILGPNEAGKSTCHEFVRFVLYGPPTGSGSRNAPRYEPLAGGEHGGSLELVSLAGQSFRLTRKGKTPNKFRLINENMEELGPEMLAHILGQAGPDLYNTVFAFSIKELYDLNALDPKQTPDVLCGINFGLGNISVSAVLKSMEQQQDKLYAPRAANRVLNELFRELKQVQEKLAPLRHNLEEYAALDAQLAELAEEGASPQAELDNLRAEEDKFKTAQRLLPLWLKHKDLENKLAADSETPQKDFLADDLTRVERLEERQKDSLAHLARTQAQIDELATKVALPFPNPVLLEVDELLADLTGRRGQYSEGRELIPQKRIQLTEVETSIAAVLARLDRNWTRNLAMSFNFGNKAWLEQLLADLQQSERDAAQAQGEKERFLREAKALAAPEKLEDLPTAEALRANLRDLRELRDQERGLDHGLQMDILRSAEQRRTKQYGLLLLGLYCALLGGNLLGLWHSAGLGLGAGLAVMALFAALTPLLPKKPDKEAAARQAKLAETAAQKAELCTALGAVAADVDFTAVEERIDLITKIEQLKEHMATEEAKATVNNNNSAGLRSKLRESLLELGINPDCSAAEVKAIIDRIRELQPLMAREDALNHDIELWEKHLDAFSNGLAYLISRTGIDWALDPHGAPDPLLTLDRVDTAVQAAKADKLSRRHLEQQLRDLKVEQTRQTEAYSRLMSELQELLRSRAVTSPDEFRQAFTRWREIEEIKSRLDQLQKEILAGAGERSEEVLHLLGNISAERLERQIANLARRIAEQGQLTAERQQQQGKIRQQRDALIDERRFEELRFREEALKEEISEAAQTWARLTLARHAVTEAKAFFEQERQPDVMRAASDWFKAITLDEYLGICPDSEPGSLAVLTAKKEPRLVTQLSRGTREQLFLAMRLALIRDRSRDAEPLPVLMDDILVNFDPERAKAAAKAVLTLAGDHQILFFTCHPHTAEMFATLAREARRPVGTFVIDDGRLHSA